MGMIVSMRTLARMSRTFGTVPKLRGCHKGVDSCKRTCLIFGLWRRSLLDGEINLSKCNVEGEEKGEGGGNGA